MSQMKDEIREILKKMYVTVTPYAGEDIDEAVKRIQKLISQNYIPKERVLTRKEIEEIIETWFVKQESILSNEQIKEVDTKGVWQVDLKSLSFDEIKKGLAQAILNNNKEKE